MSSDRSRSNSEQPFSPTGSECSTSTGQAHADRKKETHLRCERQRREAINNGYADLKDLIPNSMATMGCKTTNAAILFRACEYINQLQNDIAADEAEVQQLESKISALSMIAEQYEKMTVDSAQETNTIQMKMLGILMDDAYDSFARNVNLTDYSTITRTLIPWIETLEGDTQKTMETLVSMPFKQSRT